jgi:hypothetical protein
MNTSDDSILNNHHTVPTLELIDIEGVSSNNTPDYYSKLNSKKDVSCL